MDEMPGDAQRPVATLMGTLMGAAGVQFAGGFALGLEAAARHPEWLAAMSRQFVAVASPPTPSTLSVRLQLDQLVRVFPVSAVEQALPERPERGGPDVV